MTYRLEEIPEGVRAECVEMDVAAEAPTPEAAVEALRAAIIEKMTPEAVAPPRHAELGPILLEPAGVAPSHS